MSGEFTAEALRYDAINQLEQQLEEFGLGRFTREEVDQMIQSYVERRPEDAAAAAFVAGWISAMEECGATIAPYLVT